MSIVQLSYKQVIAKGESDLSLIGKNITSIDARMAVISAELATLQAREQTRATNLVALWQTANLHLVEHEKLTVASELQAGTLAQGTATKPAQEAQKQAEKSSRALAEAERKATGDREKDAHRLEELSAERQKLESDLAGLRTREQAVNAVIAEAQASIGADTYSHIAAKFDELEQEVKRTGHAAQFATFQLVGYGTEALAQLEQWPELQARIRPRLAVRDSTSTIIENALSLLDAVITSGKQAQVSTDVCRQALPWSSSLAEFLLIDQESLWPALSTSANDSPAALQERRGNLAKLLAVYRDVKRGIPT
jgi:chromosome segregation ATPase